MCVDVFLLGFDYVLDRCLLCFTKFLIRNDYGLFGKIKVFILRTNVFKFSYVSCMDITIITSVKLR